MVNRQVTNSTLLFSVSYASDTITVVFHGGSEDGVDEERDATSHIEEAKSGSSRSPNSNGRSNKESCRDTGKQSWVDTGILRQWQSQFKMPAMSLAYQTR